MSSKPANFAMSQTRQFWGWRRHDWSSHLDPLFHRSMRYRTLKTKAKFLDKLRRKGKFEWDDSVKPFMSPKHIRWASHWNGRPAWRQPVTESEQKKTSDAEPNQAQSSAEEDIELSPRERRWKEMQKLIDQDPYEAVFGKRFEPFYNPLLPSWMRDAASTKVVSSASQSSPASKTSPAEAVRGKHDKSNTPPVSESSTPTGPKSYAYASSTSWDSRSNKTVRTVWDSVSQQTRSFEFDAVSNRMVQVAPPEPAQHGVDVSEALNPRPRSSDASRRPIPIPTHSVGTSNTENGLAIASQTKPTKPAALANLPRSDLDLLTADDVRASMGKTKEVACGPKPTTPAEKAAMRHDFDAKSKQLDLEMNTLLKERNALRGSPSPQNLESALQRMQNRTTNKIIDLDDSAAHESTEPIPTSSTVPRQWSEQADLLQADRIRRTSPTASLPASYARVPSNPELDATADTLRSEKGPQLPGNVPTTFPRQSSLDDQSDTLRLERLRAPSTTSTSHSYDPLNAKSNTLSQEKVGSLFPQSSKLDRQLDTLKKEKVTTRLDTLMDTIKHEQAPTSLDSEMDTLRKEKSLAKLAEWTDLDQSMDTPRKKKAPAQTVLSSDLDKHMQTLANEKPAQLPSRSVRKATGLDAAMNTLQKEKKLASASTSDPLDSRMDTLRVEAVNLKKMETDYEARLNDQANTLKAEKAQLERANTILQQEVEDQQSRMHSHESRYAHKIQSLRTELETAYKQSSKHADAHVDRIRNLEAELLKAQKASGEGSQHGGNPANTMQGEGDVCANVANFANSAKWYKQLAPGPTAAEVEKAKQKARDVALVKEVRAIYEKAYGKIDESHEQPKPAKAPVAEKTELRKQLHKTHRTFTPADEERCLEMRKAGASWSEIANSLPERTRHNADKKTRQVVEVESDVDLGEALAEHERNQGITYVFHPDGLEADLAKKAQEPVDDDQAASMLLAPESSFKMRETIATSLKTDVTDARHSARNSAQVPAAKPLESVTKEEPSVEWETPALYKVLAYDSGNDSFSTATTTSNFTPSEKPISIPTALAQLYQPARFVPHFAQLQKEGFQVIYGTRDLLVFKKVKTAAPAAKDVPEAFGLGDHGLIKPMENVVAQEAAMYFDRFGPTEKEYDPTSIENGTLMPKENAMGRDAANYYDKVRSAVNPIDGTTRMDVKPPTGNFASPTGFVNLDPIEDRDVTKEEQEQQDGNVHYPRVKRQEPVFSGASRARGRSERQQRQEERRQWREAREKRRRRGAGAIRWTLSVGLCSAAMCYAIGVAAEAGRQEKKERARFEMIEGKPTRWF